MCKAWEEQPLHGVPISLELVCGQLNGSSARQLCVLENGHAVNHLDEFTALASGTDLYLAPHAIWCHIQMATMQTG